MQKCKTFIPKKYITQSFDTINLIKIVNYLAYL
jgi:hypothetical protein